MSTSRRGDRALIHWMGGVHTELRLPRRRAASATAPRPYVAAVRHSCCIANDDLIAGMLNRNKLTTAR